MKLLYNYKDKVFSCLQDIIDNNKLEIDFESICEELIPFQAFITGRTFFKGVSIEPSFKYQPDKQDNDIIFNNVFFSNGVDSYLKENNYSNLKNPIATVSGGIDSSVVAMELKPKIIYSGYYDDDEFFDETPYSKSVAKAINVKHLLFKLTEDDFLNNLYEYIKMSGSPIVGLGAIMEFTLLKKILYEEKIDTDCILFGNGGDEIFMGYYFNYFVKDFWEYGHEKIEKYMSNFLPTKISITEKVIDFMLIASLTRSSIDSLYSPFVINNFLPRIQQIETLLDKLLFININYTLPTLLNMYSQFSNYFGIKCLNPLANDLFINSARKINEPMTEIPKNKLREIHKELPDKVRKNYLKRGFPIPIHNWKKLENIMKEPYDSFFNRKNVTLEKRLFDGINRFTWGVFQAELFLRSMGK